jgi:DNA polymerase-3 subunit epsilon
MTRGQDALLIEPTTKESAGPAMESVDLRSFTLTVPVASEQELAAHEDLLNQLDKASGGKTVWRLAA